MRLAIVSHCFPPYLARSGGIATYSYNLAHALAEAGVEVTVFCGAPKSLVIREGNLTIFRLPYTLAEVPPNFVWFQLQNRKFLVEKLKKFELIHSQSPGNTISLLAKLKSRETKWVITLHSCHRRELQALFSEPVSQWSARDLLTYVFGTPIWEFLYRTEIRYADHYFFTARTNIDDYVKFYNVEPSKFTFIPNGVDLSEMREASENNEQAEDGSQTILFFGRLYARKGAEYLVRAMRYVIEENKDAKLKIFGSGPQEAILRSLIRKLDLCKSVSMEGFVLRKKLLSELCNCALVVFPSLFEVQCTSVLEAMACRKPVVAFRIPSMEEIISHIKTGYLVPKQDTVKLSEGINFLLDNDKLRRNLGGAAFNYVQKEHDWKKLAKKYIETYESLF